MDEKILQTHEATRSLPILDETDWIAEFLNSQSIGENLAEASDTIRMFDLLNSSDYRPVAAIRTSDGESAGIRLYFRKASSVERHSGQMLQIFQNDSQSGQQN